MIQKQIIFPQYTGIKCNMMPIIQGDSSSLPVKYKSYADIVDTNYIERGKIGFLTIDESYVNAGKSQRGYNNAGIKRNVHIEVGRDSNIPDIQFWGGGGGCSWGGHHNTLLDANTEVLIANSISDTCRLYNVLDTRPTLDGDLSEYIDDYPENGGILLKSGELAKISIFTPHECIAQTISGNRQFFRLVGSGVHGREPYFTINPLVHHN